MCNVSSLPLDGQSTFIRSQNGGAQNRSPFGRGGNFGGGFGGRGGLMSYLGNMQEETKTCPNTGTR
jgi:hypothetical protein